jgi:ectoine hydroxylase-related dioxygenase (phytanoyl-CoA dioxygenase family)
MEINFDISKFDELGYVVIKDFLSWNEHSKILKACDRYYTHSLSLTEDQEVSGDRGKGLFRLNSSRNMNKIEGAFNFSKDFFDLGNHKILTQTARKILKTNDNIDTYISKFFPMIPNVGISTLMHQDNFYFKGDEKQCVSCAIYLQDTNKENGCLRVVPGSHKRGIKAHTVKSNIKGLYWIDESKIRGEILDLELDAPYAVFFNINLIHGCYENKSDRTRFSLAWEYIKTKYTNVPNDEAIWCDRNICHT